MNTDAKSNPRDPPEPDVVALTSTSARTEHSRWTPRRRASVFAQTARPSHAFGEGNVGALIRSVERDQARRGVFHDAR
jgi:hypothetical protein